MPFDSALHKEGGGGEWGVRVYAQKVQMYLLVG